MAITASSRGIPISTIKPQALQQAVGNQGPYYLNQIISALGPNPKVKILEDGVLKYQDTVPGTLTVTSNYIQLPSSLNEPPETSETDTLSGTCFLEIEKATDANVALVVPLSLPAADPTDLKVDLSAGLTAGVAVKTNNLRLYAPVTLDVVTGTGGGGQNNYQPPPSGGIQRTIYTVNDPPVLVPTTLMGGSFHRHPANTLGEPNFTGPGGSEGSPPFQIKVIGAHSRVGASWAGIVNKGWSHYDEYKTWGNGFGAKVHFPLFQAPNEVVQSGYGQTRPYFPGLQNGGVDLGNAPPRPGETKNFIISLLNHDTTLETIEAWNEYEERTGYFQGDRFDMARMMRECNEARLQIRPSVKILWPGMVNWDSLTDPNTGFQNWQDLASASDGAGGQARDHIQGIGHHSYMQPSSTADQITIYYLKVKKSCENMGKGSLPRYQTECGFLDGQTTNASNAARCYGQLALCSAIFGYQFHNPWSMDIPNQWGGNMPWTTTEIISRHNQVAGLMGKTIRWAYVMTNNTITCGTGDGMVVTI